MEDTITITQAGSTVALAGRERFWLAAHIEALPDGHPRKRHGCFMAMYAREILTGDMPGPYTDSDADRFARLAAGAGNRGVVRTHAPTTSSSRLTSTGHRRTHGVLRRRSQWDPSRSSSRIAGACWGLPSIGAETREFG